MTSNSYNSYALLNNYNSSVPGMMRMPYVNPQVTIGSYIVPNYGSPGYNTLMHGLSRSGSGYFDITSAYGAGAQNCNTQFLQRACNGFL